MNAEVESDLKIKQLMLEINDTNVTRTALSVTNATDLMAVLFNCVISTHILEFVLGNSMKCQSYLFKRRCRLESERDRQLWSTYYVN